MIYDCILYSGEKDLLDIRLHETELFDDEVTTVLIEANCTHTGKIKPYHFLEHKNQFEEFNIMYLSIDDMPQNCTARTREEHQRNKILSALDLLSPKDDDVIIIADVDEIPRARQVNLFRHSMQFASLMMSKYAYYLNRVESENSWDRARIMLYGYLKYKTPEEVRNSGYDYTINHAGWHFSWAHEPLTKLQSFSHTELDTKENVEKIKSGLNIWSDDKLRTVDIDLSFPRYLYDNQDKFKHLCTTTA